MNALEEFRIKKRELDVNYTECIACHSKKISKIFNGSFYDFDKYDIYCLDCHYLQEVYI